MYYVKYERPLFVPCIEKLIPSPLLWDKPVWCPWVHQASSHLDDSSDIRIQRSEPDNKEGRWQRQSFYEETYHVKDAKDCTKYKERAGRRLHPLLFQKSIQSVLWSLYPETSQIARKGIPSWKLKEYFGNNPGRHENILTIDYNVNIGIAKNRCQWKEITRRASRWTESLSGERDREKWSCSAANIFLFFTDPK